MKTPLLIAAIVILFSSCKKTDAPSGCFLVRSSSGGSGREFAYNSDGTIHSIDGQSFRLFNNNTLLFQTHDNDTIVLDNGRLQQVHIPFAGIGRQKIRYQYDAQGQLIRTITTNGNGSEYFTDLAWENGNLISYKYSVDGQPAGNIRLISYHNTGNRYGVPGLFHVNQGATVISRNLPKQIISDYDTTDIEYRFDAEGKVSQSINSRAGGRQVWTTDYGYNCF